MKIFILFMLLTTAAIGQDKTDTTSAKYLFVKYDTTKFFNPINTRLNIYGPTKELVAYRKIDSAWVFLNPGGTIASFDSIAKRYLGWDPVTTRIKIRVSNHDIESLEERIKFDTFPVYLHYRLPSGESAIVKGWEVKKAVGQEPYWNEKPGDIRTVYDHGNRVEKPDGYNYVYAFVCYLRFDRGRFPKGTIIWKLDKPLIQL